MRNYYPLIKRGISTLLQLTQGEILVVDGRWVRAWDVTVVEDRGDWLISFYHADPGFNPGEEYFETRLRNQVFGHGQVMGCTTRLGCQLVTLVGHGKAYGDT